MPSILPITLLLGAAFALSVFHYMGPTVHLLIYASLLMLAALTVFFIGTVNRRTIHWSRLHTVFSAYVIWLVVLIYTSTLPGNTVLFFWLLLTFPAVVLLCSGFSEEDWQRLFAVFLLAGLTTAGWGIAEFWTTGRRADGPLIDPNLWCSVNNLLFFGTLSCYLSARKHRWIYPVVLFVFSMASFAAYSRVGTLIFVAALVFVVAVLFYDSRFRSRLLTTIAAVLASLTLVYGTVDLQGATSNPEGYTLDARVQGWSQRFALWGAAIEIYKEHPIAGSGPGTFKLHYPRFRTADDITNSGNFVHNDYIQFLSEGGPLMLLFLVSLVLFLAVKLWLSVLLVYKTGAGMQNLVLITAMGTTLVHGIMNFPLFNLSVQMLFGLYLVRVIGPSVATVRLQLTNPWLPRIGAILVTLYLSCVLIADAVIADIVYDGYRLPYTKVLKEDKQLYLSVIGTLKMLRPQNPSCHFALATLYRMSMDEQTDAANRQSLAIASALSYQQGIELNPFNYRVRLYFAELLQEQPQLLAEEYIYQTPLRLLQENVTRAPVYIENQMDLADYLAKTGAADTAYRILLDDALPWADVRHAEYSEYRLKLYRKIYHQAMQRADQGGLRRLLSSIENAR